MSVVSKNLSFLCSVQKFNLLYAYTRNKYKAMNAQWKRAAKAHVFFAHKI